MRRGWLDVSGAAQTLLPALTQANHLPPAPYRLTNMPSTSMPLPSSIAHRSSPASPAYHQPPAKPAPLTGPRHPGWRPPPAARPPETPLQLPPGGSASHPGPGSRPGGRRRCPRWARTGATPRGTPAGVGSGSGFGLGGGWGVGGVAREGLGGKDMRAGHCGSAAPWGARPSPPGICLQPGPAKHVAPWPAPSQANKQAPPLACCAR